jgi:predicted PhzF superfamily epimerase YddE/YHI9
MRGTPHTWFGMNHLAPVLNLNEFNFDPRFPIQDVSTGLPFLIVPLKGLDAVRRAHTPILSV